jgi:hypothetical protein
VQADSSSSPTPQEELDLYARLASETKIPSSVHRWWRDVVFAADQHRPPQLTREQWFRLVLAVIQTESNGNPEAIGDAGKAFGLMQIHTDFHPEFAALSRAQRLDPATNIAYGSRLLSQLIAYWSTAFAGNVQLAVRSALAEYNAGRGGVTRALSQGLDPDTYTNRGRYASSTLSHYSTGGGTLFGGAA